MFSHLQGPIHFYKTSDAKKSCCSEAKEKGVNIQFKNNCWHYFIRCLSLMVLEHVVLVD